MSALIILSVVFAIIFILFSIYKKEKYKEQIRFDNELLCTVTSLTRGTEMERELVLSLLKHGVPPITIYHDLYVPKKSGGYAQVDMVVVTSVGIIVVEAKDYGGWIFGNGKQQQWTQVLAYGKKKYRFYNPILQNMLHIHYLKEVCTQFYSIPFYNVAVFSDRSHLRELNFIPNNTFVTTQHRLIEVIGHIKCSNPTAKYQNKSEVINVLKRMVENGNKEGIEIEHIHNIHEAMGKERIFD